MNSESNKSIILSVGASIVLKKFLDLAGAKISFGTVGQAIEDHYKESHFSLLEIKKILEEWGFETFAAKVKSHALSELEYPVISHTEENDTEEFILLTNYSNEVITYIQPGTKETKEKLEDFLVKWKGVILMAHSHNQIIESDYEEKKLKDENIQNDYLNNKTKLIDNFFSAQECHQIIENSKTLFKRSLVTGDGKHQVASHRRTSESASLHNLDENLKEAIAEKCISLLESDDLSYNDFENLQCVSYQINQEFKAHFDAGKGLKRLYTILVYLNDDIEGGETYFPLLDLMVKPKKGKAVMFHNLEKDGSIDIYSYHAGLPVRSGNKFACNIWIR